MAEHNIPAEDVLDLDGGGNGGNGLPPIFLVGQRYRAVRRADGSYIVLDQSTGNPRTNEDGTIMVLAPAAPPDPLKPNISFFQDPNTGTFFKLDANAVNDDGAQGVLTVISEQTPEVQRGFQDIFEAISAIFSAGLDETKYQYVYEDGRVVPKLVEQISPAQDSFFTSTDASGQLLVISRLTGIPTPIGQMPKAVEGKVELDPVTGQFKVTQPNGTISFLAAPTDIQLPQEVSIGGQSFAFNPNTGGFVQVQQPGREFEPDVVFKEGRAFIQGPGGELTPLGREEVPNLDELINSRIIAGDASGALALSDFRDRPTSLEAFNAAMQFAQSPGDVAAISAIARGQSLVAPPPPGTVQRIAEQPQFLQDAFSRLMNQFRGGSGSPGEFMDVLTRINKEFTESQRALEEASESNQRLEEQSAIDKALAPFKDKITALEKEQAVSKAGVKGLFKTEQAALGRDPTFIEIESAIRRGGFSDVSGEDIISSGVRSFSPTTQSLAESARTGASNVMDLFNAAREEAAGFSGSSDTSKTTVSQEEIQSFLDSFEHGGVAKGSNLEVVGEGGPELVDLPPGTVVTPIEKLSAAKVKKLKEMGIRGMQEGGTVDVHPDDIIGTGNWVTFQGAAYQVVKGGGSFEIGTTFWISFDGTLANSFMVNGGQIGQLPPGTTRPKGTLGTLTGTGPSGGTRVEPSPPTPTPTPPPTPTPTPTPAPSPAPLPIGVRRALSGGIIQPTRRRLSTAAGIPVLSAQARQNLLPEELDVFNRLSREAGIPEGAFAQEQESAFPGANLARGRARFAPRVLR